MNVGIILPHLKPFGGVRRFIEVGQHLKQRDHDVTIWTERPGGIEWAAPWNAPRVEVLRKGVDVAPGGVVLIGDPPSFGLLDIYASRAEIWYVWVIAGGEYTKMYRQLYDKQHDHVRFLLNNRAFKPDYPAARLCEGGVNTKFFKPTKKRRVGYYAGRGRTKGEQHIVDSLKGIKGLELVPLQGLSSPALRAAYQTLDWFVCWEQRMGWSNTAAEAVACGLPVVTNGVNCEPFLDRVVVVDNLRKFFTDPMADLYWARVVDRLEQLWKEDGLL